MTNDEILRLCVWLDMDIAEARAKGAPMRPVLEGFARSLVSTAYAEAARLAVNPYGNEVQAMAGDEPSAVGEKIARAIRVLQDSLSTADVAEPTTSGASPKASP